MNQQSDTDEINDAVDSSQMTERNERVWAVCDELAAQGTKPSLRIVRAHGRVKGSDSDVQKDVNAWYKHVWKKHTQAAMEAEIPTVLKETLFKLWTLAFSEATGTFAAERDQIQKEKAQCVENEKQANQERLEIAERLHLSEEKIATLERKVRSLTQTTIADKETIDLLRTEKESDLKKIDALQLAMFHLKQDHGATIKAVNEEHAAREKTNLTNHESVVLTLTQSHKNRIAEYTKVMELAEERYKALEQRSLREIDTSREQIRDLKKSVEAGQSQLMSMQELLSKARERIAGLETLNTTGNEHRATLENQLNAEREQSIELRITVGQLQSQINSALPKQRVKSKPKARSNPTPK